MSTDGYWLSRVVPRDEVSWRQLIRLVGLDPYRQHQELWKLFDLPSKEHRAPEEPIPFLFRAERIEPASCSGQRNSRLVGLPVFYVLSKQIPRDATGLWHIDTPENGYRPDLRAGDRLIFKLRANPVVTRKAEREEEKKEAWLEKRKALGLKTEDPTKRIRHDVVMEAKRNMDWKHTPHGQRPTLAKLAYDAGSRWLEGKAAKFGFEIETTRIEDGYFEDPIVMSSLRVDGYSSWRQRYGKKIELSILDFEGKLVVTDPAKFNKALYEGIGPAKSFGCGLLLVRRVV
jgi:CRISPR system Cascade subunit CasE